MSTVVDTILREEMDAEVEQQAINDEDDSIVEIIMDKDSIKASAGSIFDDPII